MSCFGCKSYVEIIDVENGIGVTRRKCKLKCRRLLTEEFVAGCEKYMKEKKGAE